MVTILDLRSGDLRLVIDTSMEVMSLRTTESTVVVVSEKEVVTWNLPLPKENCAYNARANVDDSIRTTPLDHSPPSTQRAEHISISLDLSHIIITRIHLHPPRAHLEIYDASTGKYLAGTRTTLLRLHGFTPDGRKVWGANGGGEHPVKVCRIVEDSKTSRVAELETLGRTACPLGVAPWQSLRGYGVTSDGWVLSPTAKRLLRLPHYWRSHDKYRTWSGRFLGLKHDRLPEVVILEFFE